MRSLNRSIFLSLFFCSYLLHAQSTIKKVTVRDSIKQDSLNINLKTVNIVLRDPISEKFSVTKLNKIDIYFNPVSNADPLKAITILPGSTNTSETANPTLRGGDADRSRVFINGSPVLNPVRNSQDNGSGNFSLFNTELIENQYVYASNPPLTFGNSSAGIVQIETNKTLEQENLQLSLSLSNLGVLLNKKIGKGSFIQLYSNHQFSKLFIDLNKSNLPNLQNFATDDIGANMHVAISDKISFNSYNYFIDENYRSTNYMLNFSDNSVAKQKRFFSINSIEYKKAKSIFKFSSLIDFSNQKYVFGVINSNADYFQYFNTASQKIYINNEIKLQYGLDYSISKYTYNEVRPVYYFALTNSSKTYNNNEVKNFQYLEPYVYLNYDVSNKLGFSIALRKNIPLQNQQNFTSYQFALNYDADRKSKFIFSAGNYHSYTTPNYISHEISLLSSKQIALDYYYTTKKIKITSAIYYKQDAGNYAISQIESFNSKNTFGIEFSTNYNFNKYLSIGLSNTYLKQKIKANGIQYRNNLNLKYFVKSQLSYLNPKIFNASLAFTTRPGSYYTQVQNAGFNSIANAYEPVFDELDNAQFKSYSRLDFTINKAFQFKKNGLIAYISINNLLDTKNEASINYNQNYSKQFFYYYQQKIIYFGVQYRVIFRKNKRD